MGHRRTTNAEAETQENGDVKQGQKWASVVEEMQYNMYGRNEETGRRRYWWHRLRTMGMATAEI